MLSDKLCALGGERKANMNSEERVMRAVHFQGPDRVPIVFFNRDFEQADLILIDVVQHWAGASKDTSEWEFRWEKLDETMGQPKGSLIHTWDEFEKLNIPNPYSPSRFDAVPGLMRKYSGKYYVASLGLSGFTIMTCLRGFAETLEDLYLDRENIERLANVVFSFEEEVIGQLKSYGFHAVFFADDWGTQTDLIVSPALWRDFFKPRYKKQFDWAHKNGLDVYFHCCGQIEEIIPDLIEIGVDILNLSQPNLFNVKKLGERFGGKVCFLCPISYQTTSLSGSKEDIYADAKSMIDNLGRTNGGFIGYIEEYHSIGLTEENYQNCVNAFRDLGRYP